MLSASESNEAINTIDNTIDKSQHHSSSFLNLNSNHPSKSEINLSDSNIEPFNSNEFSIKIGSSEFYPKKSQKDTILEYLNQARLELAGVVDSAAPVYFFGKILPPGAIPAPYELMMCTVNFAMNHKIGHVLGSFLKRSSPFSSLRIEGRGSVASGLLKKGIKHINSIATVLFVGCAIGNLVMRNSEVRNGLNEKISFNHPLVFVPILGLTGLLIDRLVLKAWDRCWPPREEQIINYRVNLLQEFGQYAMSYFGAYTWDIMLAEFLKAAGVEGMIWNPNMKMLRMMSCYVVRESLSYQHHHENSSQENYQIDSYTTTISEDEMNVIQEVQPNHCHGMYRIGTHGGITLLLLIMSYFTNLYAMDEGLCKENTLASNTECSLLALATVIFAEFLIKSVTPKICRFNSFFSQSKKEEGYNSLLDMPNVLETDFSTKIEKK